MNLRVLIALAIGSLIPALPARAGDVVDRIVATVNGQIILQSDWEDASRFETFVGRRSLSDLSAADRKADLDHLIDQELLREQMRPTDLLPPTQAEIESGIKEIRKQFEDAKTDAEWKSLLEANHVTEDLLRRQVTVQLELSRLVDSHLRASANISARSIESYYQQELLPQLQRAGAKEAPLTDVAPKIRELLTQQKINELLVAWIQTLRAGSEIHTLYPSADESLAR